MASQNIAFSSIPSSIRKPGKYFEYNAALAVRSLPTNLQRVLIVAQMLTSGATATANAVVQVFDSETAAALFGRGSQAHRMVKAALNANRYAQLFVLPVADAASSVAATATVTASGAATTAGTLVLTVCGVRAEVAVASGDTAATFATNLNAALALLTDLPVTRSVAAGVVTLTQRNKGTVGNAHLVKVSGTVAGLTVAATAFTGGTLDPTLATALAAAFGGGHEILVVPYSTGTPLTDLRTHLNAVSDPMERRPAIGVYASGGTLSAATTQAGTLNGNRLTAGFLKNSSTPAEELAGMYASVVAFEEDPARPLNTLVLTGAVAPDVADRLSRTEQESCLANGVTPLEWGPGDVVQIVRAVTTYTLNPSSVADVSWLDLTTMRTMDYVMKAMRTRVELRFPRDKLSAKTPARVRSELLDVALKLEELEIVENVDKWANDLVVERDSQDVNRLNAKIPVDVVNGLHVFAGRLDLIL
jgi:phage tail sheath gpL-like